MEGKGNCGEEGEEGEGRKRSDKTVIYTSRLLTVCSFTFAYVQHGQTALMKASRSGNVEVTRHLVAARAIPDLKSKV